MAEYESLESIIVGVEAGCGVAIVYQSTSCVSLASAWRCAL